MNNNQKLKYRYIGAIHIHSLFSDGTGDIFEITKAAKKSGLDWIVMTDHNNMDISDGVINGVTVVKGEEISYGNENHYIALGINECVSSDKPSKFVEEVRQMGGFGFIAHPDELINRKNSYPPIRWNDETPQADGVEIWNWFSQWADNYNDKNILNIAYSFLFKHNLVSSPYPQTLSRWDRMNSQSDKIVPAIGGLDSHAMKISKYILPVCVFPYKTLFNTIGNVLYFDKPLEESFEERKKQILNALRKGNNLIVNRTLLKQCPDVYVENGNCKCFCGETTELTNETFFNVNLPKKSDILILKNGEKFAYICKQAKCKLHLKDRGKYRVEIKINNKGFAYSNPIVVK